MNVLPMVIWIAVGSFGGFYLSKSYKNRVAILSEIDFLASELLENVSSFKKPTREVLESFNFKTQLRDVIKSEDFKTELLKEEEVLLLKNLLLEISVCETATAKSKLEYFKAKNKTALEEAKKNYSQKGVAYQKLGVLFGLLVGVIFM